MRQFTNLTFYNAWNDRILYYGKRTSDLSSVLLFAVTLDPREPQGAHFEVPSGNSACRDHATLEAVDLVNRTALRVARQGPAHVVGPARPAIHGLASSGPAGAAMTDRPASPLRRRSAQVSAGPRRRSRPAGRRLVQGRRHLPVARQGVPGRQRRRGRGLRRADRSSRLRGATRRRHHLDAALLPLAAARRRLRHRRLHLGEPCLRADGRLQAAGPGGPQAKPQGDHRAGDQPHLRSAPLVPARPQGQARQPGPRLLRLERQRRALSPAPASSSSTPSARTGPGTQRPGSSSGTASIRTSPT